jgi:hypothetical protein
VLFSEQASLEDPISKSHKLDPSGRDRFNKSELLIASDLIPEVRGVGMGKGASVPTPKESNSEKPNSWSSDDWGIINQDSNG